VGLRLSIPPATLLPAFVPSIAWAAIEANA
jgi:hypothetical protein